VEVRALNVALIHAGIVGLGGFLGSLARYGLSGLVQRQFPVADFPYGTLAVNLLGCLLIGVMASLMEARGLFSPEFRVFALIGVLGGFTTFSTLGWETFVMLRDTEYVRAAANVTLHVAAGLTLVWVGYAATTAAVK
jgi:fluoride exporter